MTALTVGGALGLVPGAAVGDTGRGAARPAGSAADASTLDPSDAGATSSDEGAHHRGDSGGWLTVEPGSDDPATASSSDEVLPAESGHGKRIVFDISEQRVWLVDPDNSVGRTYLVSGGVRDNLTADTYEVYSKSRHAVSFDNRETMNYMVRFAHGANAPIGFHDIPAYEDGTLAQTRADLGSPQSAGCIRQWEVDAKALWQFSSVGTTVVVMP